MASRKRLYRHRVRCEECNKEIDSDYKEVHSRLIHNGKKVKCHPVMESSDSSQSKISAFFPKSNMTTKDDDLQYSVNLLRTESSGSKDSTATVCFDEDLSEKNVKKPMSEDQTEPMTAFIDVDELNVLSQLRENSEQNTVTDSESVTQESMTTSNILAPTPMDDLSSPAPILDEQFEKVSVPSENTENISTPPAPKQPILDEYPARKFGNETFVRRFQSEWYKKYPWISYEVANDACVCFACVEFGKDTSFVFMNWKKSEKLTKHGKSENHVRSMTRWLQFKAMQRNQTSVLQQLNSAHQDQVASNRQYLKVVIQSLMYTAQQNVAIRGHEENRNDIWEVSDINRGKFLELLCIRRNDLPWLRSKLQSQHQLRAQWTSPVIQNDLLEIVANVMLERIAAEARSSDYFGLVVDETADISRTEQISLFLRYIFNGESKETFTGFYSTKSTEGDVLHELVKTAISKLELRLEDIVAECFDGAANISGARKGLAARKKECSPRYDDHN